MKASKLLSTSGIHCYPDRVDVDHLRYSGQTRRRVIRFCAIQSTVLRSVNAPGICAGRFVCLDLVRPSELRAALDAEVYTLRDRPCVELRFADVDRIDRRALSHFTTLALAERTTTTEEELAALELLLESVPEYRAIAAMERLVELERDLACWAVHRLPKPLWAHVCGLRPMAALARSQAAMADVTGAPVIDFDEKVVSQRVEAADMLDVAVSAGRKADTPMLVELATDLFSIKSNESEIETLTRWGDRLLALRSRVEAEDVASGVVIAWQIDLVQSGTVTKIDAPVATRARYARVASTSLWRMLATFPTDPQRWSSAEMHSGYLAMMADPSCKDLTGLGAAISSFQAFLQEVFGFAALPLGLHKLIPESVPRAQWIPETAVRRAIRWIDVDQQGDPRLKEVCALMILLAYAAPFRINELRWLRLNNIAHAPDGSIEIEITPASGVSRLKTPAATRRVLIKDPKVIARVDALVEQREAEGALSDSLLFAAPDDDMSPYRSHAVHVTLLRLLKQATGDPEMTFHALRHTVISNAMEELLSSSSTSNNNRLTQLADWSGHEVAVTTLEFYSHWFEFALRQQIDVNLRDHSMSNSDGEKMLGIKANTLTVAAKRRRIALTEYIWQIAEERARVAMADLPTAAAGLQLHEPQPISFLGPVNRNFTIFHCLSTLELLTQGVDPALIRNRMHLSASDLAAIDRAAAEVARDIYAARGMLAPPPLTNARSVIDHFEIDLARVHQPRYEKFRAALALPQDVGLAAAAAGAWCTAWRGGELRADPPEKLVPLLVFLKSAEVSSYSLLFTYEDDGADADAVASLLVSAAAVATAIFHDHLPVKALPHARRGRGRAFLVWPSSSSAGEAGRSNAGFDALMLTVAIWSRPTIQERI
jgi:integrase